MTIGRPKTAKFLGLNNVTDPLRLNLGWLTQADNVDITSTNQLIRCRGFTHKATTFATTGAYATKDLHRLYVVDAGEVRQMNHDFTHTVLKSGLTANKVTFAEVNNRVYYTNGVDFGLLEPTGWRPWGIPSPIAPTLSSTSGTLPAGVYQVVCTYTDDRGMESSNSDVSVIALAAPGGVQITNIPQPAGYSTNVYATMQDGTVFFQIQSYAGTTLTYNATTPLGVELPFWNTSGPRGELPAEFKGKMYCAEYFPSLDISVIWNSLPMHYHHFDLSAESFAVSGQCLVLSTTDDALIIGTDRAIHAYNGEQLTELAPYGTVPGYHASRLGNDLYMWTLRGLAKMLPFVNLTESTVSVAPGLSAGATVMEKNGVRRYIVSLQKGGVAYNSRG